MSITSLRITLFGKFTIARESQRTHALVAPKLQELFSYLLLYRDRQHAREVLADRFWSDYPTSQARMHLRKALWELQKGILGCGDDPEKHVLLVDAEWVQINPKADFLARSCRVRTGI